MISTQLTYAQNDSSAKDILQHLEKCDVDFITALSTRVVLTEYAEKLYNRAVRFEAWDGSELVGLIAAYINHQTSTAYITNVSVYADRGGKGIASELMKNAIAYALEKNMIAIELEVKKDNKAAIALYHKFSFVELKEETDALIMKHKIESTK